MAVAQMMLARIRMKNGYVRVGVAHGLSIQSGLSNVATDQRTISILQVMIAFRGRIEGECTPNLHIYIYFRLFWCLVKKGGCSANECWCVSAGGSTCSQADSPPGYPRTPGECIADHCYDRSTCAVHGYWCEGTEIYKKEKQIRKKIIQKDKDGDLDDIDCNDPDEDDQFDHCDEDDVGEDGDEKWICQCIYPQNEPVCTRVINPKWTMKCGHGDAKKKMFFGRKMKVILVR